MRLGHILSGKHAGLILAELARLSKTATEKREERIMGLSERRRVWKNRQALARHRERILENPAYRMTCNLRSRLSEALRTKRARKYSVELIGCTQAELKEHLEGLFTEGMTWENYGAWHVDHIRPCASFNLLDPEEQRKCFHYTNLQPLWAEDNWRKGSKV